MQGFSPSRNTPQAAPIYNHPQDTRSDPSEKYIRDAALNALAPAGPVPTPFRGPTMFALSLQAVSQLGFCVFRPRFGAKNEGHHADFGVFLPL
jgi:hypothetical protein